MSNPRSQSPHYSSNRQHEDPPRRFPWDEPDFDPRKVVARLDDSSCRSRGQRSRGDPEDRWRYLKKEDVEDLHENRRHSYQEEPGGRTLPPPLFPGGCYGKRKRPPSSERVGRAREDLRDRGEPGGPGGGPRHSPMWPAGERPTASGSRSREPSAGWRREGRGRSQERPLDHSPRAPDRQGRGEERSQERREGSGSHMERHKENPCRDRSPISDQHMEGHVHPGYGKEEDLRGRPRDGHREAFGDVRGPKPIVVEHGHGIADPRGPAEWDAADGARQDAERHGRPRQTWFRPDSARRSNSASEPWEKGREAPFHDEGGDSGCESGRGPTGNNRTHQPGKLPPQKRHGHFGGGPPLAGDRMDAGRRGAGHDGRSASSPIHFPRGRQDHSQEHQRFPQERQGFPQERQGFPQERQGFPQERQGFPQERQGFPQRRQEFDQDHQELSSERPDFPRGGQAFPMQRRPEFPSRECQKFPGERRPEFPSRECQKFPGERRQEFPRQGRGGQQFPPGHKGFNQGHQGRAYREQRDNDCHVEPRQGDPGWGKDARPLVGRSTMSGEMARPLDTVGPGQRERRWKNQLEPSDVMVVSEETLTIKVDMNRPVSKNSALCYSSDRQLSLDLVNVGRQRLDFLPMMEHSGTYRENTVRSGTFAQEVITLVHQVKEQYFRGNTISLNQRFSAPQDGGMGEAPEDEVATEDQRPTLNKRFTMTMNTLPVREPVFAAQPDSPEPLRDPEDLRNNLERRRQERTEAVKITIAGGGWPHAAPGPPGPASEPAAMFGETDGFGEQEEEAGFPGRPDRQADKHQDPRNRRFQTRGRVPWRLSAGAPDGNGHFGNRLGPPQR